MILKGSITFLFALIPCSVLAQAECLFGTPNNLIYVEELQTNQDPLTKMFRTMVCPDVDPYNLSSGAQTNGILAVFEVGRNKTPIIKQECIAASLKRQISGRKINCKATTRSKRYIDSNDPQKTPCVTTENLQYITYSVNKALACMSDTFGIDPELVNQFYNNETGYQYYFTSTNGKGIGQLTNDAIHALTDDPSGKLIMQDFMKATNPSCKPFQIILSPEVKDPSLITKVENNCQWAGGGEAFARNLIYSMAYMHHLKVDYLDQYVKKYTTAQNSKLMKLALTMAYGPSGPAGAISTLQAARGDENKILELAQKCGKTSRCGLSDSQQDAVGYLRAAQDKLSEQENLREEIKRGTSCIQ